jgi:hypothetical protein
MLRHLSQGYEWCADGQIGIGEVAPIPSLHLRRATTGKTADLAQDCCRADTPLRSLSNVSRSRPKPMPECHEDRGRVPMAVPSPPGGLDQGLDLLWSEVLAGAKLCVWTPSETNS